MKVWILTNTPSPYQVEFLSALRADGRCVPSVRFFRGKHRGETWRPAPGQDLEGRVLRGFGPSTWSDAFRLHPAALRECLRGPWDLYVLSGQYTSFTFVACALLLSWRRKPWVMWLEQPWPEDYRPAWTRSISARSGAARAVRRRVLAMLIRRTQRMFCIGTAAVEAYRGLGAPDDKLELLPYCCDTDRYASPDPAAVERVRKGFSLHGKTVFLFSGQLIERKGVDVLLDAFAELAGPHDQAVLIVLGDGPLRNRLAERVPEPCRSRVHFAGHLPQEDLPAYFGAADVFVLPSRHDGWGVVVNEACGAGLPVLATDAAGAARDLVRDGENGFVVPRDDAAQLRERMEFLLKHPEQRKAFGRRSREILRDFSLPRGVERFCAGAEKTLGGR